MVCTSCCCSFSKHDALLSLTCCLQDQEPLSLRGADLCGGGTGQPLQQQDLPLGFTLGYAKANGCPVEVCPGLQCLLALTRALTCLPALLAQQLRP